MSPRPQLIVGAVKRGYRRPRRKIALPSFAMLDSDVSPANTDTTRLSPDTRAVARENACR
jgi:hypothetical protein